MPSQGIPFVFVIDDDFAVREALDSLLRSAGLKVKTFASAHEFLGHQLPESAACIVMDVRLPEKNGFELQRELAESGRQIPIIFITGHGDIPMSVRAMKAGAVEFLTKPFRDEDLLRAIRQGLQQDEASQKARAEVLNIRHRLESLTRREQEVMDLVVEGLRNKEIAARLGTAEITVKIQRGQVMKKMGAGSIVDLVRMTEKLRAEKGGAGVH